MHASDKALIDAFLDQPDIGLAGYSRNPRKFGHTIYKTLKEKGYRLFPVNPAGGEAPGGETIYPDVASLPGEVNALVVVTRADVTPVVVDQALLKGIDYLWIQQMSGSKQLYASLAPKDVNAICGRCILLHAQPEGIHKFHRWLLGLFGQLPE